MSARRIFSASVSLVAGILLVYWAFCASRFAAGDREFILESPVMDPWAQAWMIRGDDARFRDMDTPRAVGAYWEAVGRNPLLFGGWFALARLERQMGATPRVDSLREFLLSHVPSSTTWRWHQLLLAGDSRDEARFTESFNFVLERLPQYRQEAVELALGFWGGWPAAFGRTDPANRWTLLLEAMARRDVDAATDLYPRLEADPASLPDAAGQSAFVDFLLQNRRWSEAEHAWKRSALYEGNAVANGAFETPLDGKAFGWRQGKVQGAEIRREDSRDPDRGHVMRLHFLGTSNVRFDHFWQYLPLAAGKEYEVLFSWKSERISTDKGVYLEVRGVDCPGLRARTAEVTGSGGWRRESLTFRAPDECRMARIGLRRDESLKFDNKIAGDLWIDAVELFEGHGR